MRRTAKREINYALIKVTTEESEVCIDLNIAHAIEITPRQHMKHLQPTLGQDGGNIDRAYLGADGFFLLVRTRVRHDNSLNLGCVQLLNCVPRQYS